MQEQLILFAIYWFLEVIFLGIIDIFFFGKMPKPIANISAGAIIAALIVFL